MPSQITSKLAPYCFPTKKNTKPQYNCHLVRGIHQWLVDSPHKGRVMCKVFPCPGVSLRWRHNGRNSVSNHQPHYCLLNPLFGHRSKKTSKLRVTGLCAGNSPGTGEFPAQMASNAENVSIWWRHHVMVLTKISVDIEARPSDPILVYYFSAIDSCWEMVMNQHIMAWNVKLGNKNSSQNMYVDSH